MAQHALPLDATAHALATDSLRVVSAPGKGRGVVALRAFDVGEIIEVVPVLVVRHSDVLDQTELANYVYNWPTGDNDVAIAFGFGSLYNHSYEPNARYDKRPDDGGFGTICYTCIRPIGVGDEIVINYNGAPEDRSPMWFDLAPSTGTVTGSLER
jgi:SET domain-containing protein